MSHWLAEQAERLMRLGEACHRTNAGRMKEARLAFLAAVREVVGEVARRRGVTACFTCHDGLVVESAGQAPDFEALSAMTQPWVTAAREAAATLALGAVKQMVLIGEDHKLALFIVGPLAIGILSPATIDLAYALSR